MNLKELYKALKPLKSKIILEKWINFILISVIIAFGLTIGLILLSKFTLISNIFIKVTSIFIASLLIAPLSLS